MKRTGIPHVIFCRVPMTNSEEKRLLNKYTKGIMNDPDKKWMISNYLSIFSLQEIWESEMVAINQIHHLSH